jgi:plasmid stabilization system protein ParE
MAELIWGEVAISDLESTFDYIARDSHQYASL